jgi:hypothetical protein
LRKHKLKNKENEMKKNKIELISKNSLAMFAILAICTLIIHCGGSSGSDSAASGGNGGAPGQPPASGIGAENMVTTIAGPASGATTAGSTDASGNAARFNSPTGITSDGTNLYIADSANNKVRQINITTGAVTTLAGPAAGTTTAGDANGLGTAARFNQPGDIVSDGTNLYLVEIANHKIRQIGIADGNVTTLAGAPVGCFPTCASGDTNRFSTLSRFSGPHGITALGGSLFVSDSFNHKIRNFVISNPLPANLVGPGGVLGQCTGACPSGDINETGDKVRLNNPIGIANNGTDIFVADSANNKIKRIVIASGLVTTLAGPAQGTTTSGDVDGAANSARFNFPMGLAADAANLYVADSGNNKIRKIVISSGLVSTLAGPSPGSTTAGDTDGAGADARFRTPAGLVLNGSDLYVADSGNNKIRRIR